MAHNLQFNTVVVINEAERSVVENMDLILVADCLESTQPLLRVVSKSDYRIVKLIESNDDVSRYVTSLCPDILVFISDEIDFSVTDPFNFAMICIHFPFHKKTYLSIFNGFTN